MHLPISLEKPRTRPVTPVVDSSESLRENRQQQPSSYVYRGEPLNTVSDKAYRPQPKLQISPENRRAINACQRIVEEPLQPGIILDGCF
ncbi:MAG: hypothetical protein JSU67_16585 [Gammaproteobacteria bacterium]|nr:MAG: hypothetical protein EP300_10845 [Gammaproteobacteria bacterium]UCH39744.1 MAG: hypothetical protein JSU67_16585 [Gammaproteobacteria bacterium]